MARHGIRRSVLVLLAATLLLGGCDFFEWFWGGGGNGGGDSDPPDEGTDPCALYACDGTGLWADDSLAELDGLCADRTYDMAPIVDCCGFRAGVEAAAADTCGGRFPAHAARVLYFPPGGDYLIEEPTVVEALGVVFRGGGATVLGASDAEWDMRGTVFRCAVGEGETCLTLRRDAGSVLRGTAIYEGIQMVWGGEDSPPAGVVGLLLERTSGAVVRDAGWESFPGTAVHAIGVGGGSFERLTFAGSEAGAGETALRLSCAEPGSEGGALICPNANNIGSLRVSHYGWGVRFEGGNASTIRQSAFVHSRSNAIVVDGAEAIRIEGCRFQDSQAAPSEDLAYVRLQRSPGAPWYPDVVLDGNYFQCGCREGRIPIAAYAASTIYTPFGRVSLVDNTFNNCGAGLISNQEHDGGSLMDVRTQWQCARNRVLQRTSTSPTTWETWTMDSCVTPEDLPELPASCE